ncbi:helix-turn-helix domain-containing protein [Spirosoma endbachense]|uniref:Helix-turn-helix domain-containing protein n=1 Tax=Spirosoma endbachense TaxID=2666025 RepID=A0A6P1VYQ5_9BACT|nr:helix-turn-helix domain-containing protein [Spirosoma endbachense]QHV98283.1 helix-turn-helix domain-containing protein [Spirosoma endbachense]
MFSNAPLLEQINEKLDLLLAAQPDEWLTPNDVQRIFKLGKTRFWQLVNDGAFPVSRPHSVPDKKTRSVWIKRADVEDFMRRGYPKES